MILSSIKNFLSNQGVTETETSTDTYPQNAPDPYSVCNNNADLNFQVKLESAFEQIDDSANEFEKGVISNEVDHWMDEPAVPQQRAFCNQADTAPSILDANCEQAVRDRPNLKQNVSINHQPSTATDQGEQQENPSSKLHDLQTQRAQESPIAPKREGNRDTQPSIPEKALTTENQFASNEVEIPQQQDPIEPAPPSPFDSGALAIVSNGSRKLTSSTSNSNTSTNLEFGPIKVYLDQAEMYCNEKQWEKAIAACQEALQVSPDTAAAYKLWGNILQRTDKPIDAMGCYAKALVIQPDFPEVYANLGSLYAKREQWDEAVVYYQKAITLNPKFAGAYRNLAKIWQKLNQIPKEMQCLVYAFSLDSKLGTAEDHYQLGNWLLEQGQIDEAARFYRIAVELKPNSVVACNKLAEVLEKQGDWKSAVAYYRQVLDIRAEQVPEAHSQDEGQVQSAALKTSATQPTPTATTPPIIYQQLGDISPSSPQASTTGSRGVDQTHALLKTALDQPESDTIRVQLGDLYVQQKDWTQAINAYKAALKINPKQAKVYLKLAQVFNQLKMQPQRVEAYYRAYDLDATLATPKQHCLLGKIFQKQNDLERANICFRRALRVDESYVDAYRSLGEVFDAQGNKDVAIAAYQKALTLQTGQDIKKKSGLTEEITQTMITLAPTQEDTKQALALKAHQRAETFQEQKKWIEAIAAYQEAIEHDPNFSSWSHHNLGMCYQALEQWAESAASYQNAIALNPDFLWSHVSLGDVWVNMKKWNEAIVAYQHALNIDLDSQLVLSKLADTLKLHSRASLEQAAELYLKGSQAQNAEEKIYREALSLNPHAVDIYLKLGNLLTVKGKIDEGIFIYQSARQLEPDNVELLSALSKALSQQGQWGHAIECLKHALVVEPDSSELHFELRELSEKVLCAQECLDDAYFVYLELGEILCRKEYWEEAIALFQKCIDISPNLPWAYNCMGNIFSWTDELDNAVSLYTKVIELKPDLAAPYKSLGDVYSAKGNVNEAAKYYSQMLHLEGGS